jgi:thiol:disulfide interchange protein
MKHTAISSVKFILLPMVLLSLLLPQLAQGQINFSGAPPFSVTAKLKNKPGTNEGIIEVAAEIGDGWHIYSITQPEGGPLRTEIEVDDAKGFKVEGDFEADADPHVVKEEGFDIESEFNEGNIKWTAPVTFEKGVDLKSLSANITVRGQRCSDEVGCVPLGMGANRGENKTTASYGGEIATANAETKYRPKRAHILLYGKVRHADGKDQIDPGDKAILEITTEPVDGYHVYQRKDKAPAEGNRPTLLAVSKSNSWELGAIETVTPPADKTKIKDGLTSYTGAVTYKIPFTVPKSAENKDYKITGVVAYQTCFGDETCDAPKATNWEVSFPVGKKFESTTGYVVWSADQVSYSDAEEAVKLSMVRGAEKGGEWAGYSPLVVLPLAFLAGFILNFMPCVLPVIGLKIMSFVHQAGENPRRVFMLNVVFVIGMLAVFMVFAALAVLFGVGWGEAYTSIVFKVVMIAIVFGFALSFFGIWEIPMPGIVNSETANELAAKDGYVGQFFKGILTTLLATPCSGPLLIPAVVWAIAQPPVMTFTVFLFLGLGMAVPYLVIGAFPKLASFLPKPGAWMITFKQIMGFVLLATTVFLINGVSAKFNTSVLTMLLFVGFGTWWIGQTALTEPFSKQFKAWGAGLALIFAGSYFAFFILLPQYELEYQKFSRLAVDKHLKEGHTVLVDFTADW